jgi:hypothetical protein
VFLQAKAGGVCSLCNSSYRSQLSDGSVNIDEEADHRVRNGYG